MNIHSIGEAKRRAAQLRKIAAEKGEPLPHGKALERVAREQGAHDWNTLRARLAKAEAPTPAPDFLALRRGSLVEGRYMNQPFTGRIVDVSAEGQTLRLSIHLDQAVDTVAFASFSNMRRRVSGTIGKDGQSAERTSNGIPHLMITRMNS
ncbi:glyoxalase superfamily protein [Altericroceibacterium endophyticum]|uniref:Glyoxalase-related protein domain-containing protein n=1 Tax=Altericroceibacterium endophyticum TaxID=1808508 RepID=A0A6I4T3C2_9SPHN|nr:glyoxalase superfamily protein [Altericroceibacterium endophyticum]MXO64782.1 hypothetical protein [Altericroceibacterium endophyticum]